MQASIYERHYQGQRNRLSVPQDTTDALHRHVAEHAPRLAREQEAEARFPDTLFDAHPEVQRLHSAIATAERRHALRSNPAKVRGLFADHLGALRSEIDDQEDALKRLALDDAADLDTSLARTVAALAELQGLRQQAEAAELALETLEHGNPEMERIGNDLKTLQGELRALLKRLKVEHLEAQAGQQEETR